MIDGTHSYYASSGLEGLAFLRLVLSTFVRTDQTYLAITDHLWPSQENFLKLKNLPDKHFYASATKHLGIVGWSVGRWVGLLVTNFEKAFPAEAYSCLQVCVCISL